MRWLLDRVRKDAVYWSKEEFASCCTAGERLRLWRERYEAQSLDAVERDLVPIPISLSAVVPYHKSAGGWRTSIIPIDSSIFANMSDNMAL